MCSERNFFGVQRGFLQGLSGVAAVGMLEQSATSMPQANARHVIAEFKLQESIHNIQVTISNGLSDAYPDVVSLLNHRISQAFPGFPCTSSTINTGFAAKRHRAKNKRPSA